MDNTMEKVMRTLLMRTTPRPSLFFDVEVSEHCNLNCRCCGSMAPLAEKELLDFEEYQRDLTRLSKISGGVAHHINILGGEPLLHPDITKMLLFAREKFPVGDIRLVTNGILLPQMKQEFWDALKVAKIHLAPTKYPVKVDYDAIQKKAESMGILFSYFGDAQDGPWYHNQIDITGQRNENHSFMHCGNANECGVLSHGKLYPCPKVPKIRHFNKMFHLDLPVTQYDYLDIYREGLTLQDIMEFYCHAVPFCRFCNTFAYHQTRWGISEKRIEEWT